MGGSNWTTCSTARLDPCNLCPNVECVLAPSGSSVFLSNISLPFANLHGWLPDLALSSLSMLTVLNLSGAQFLNSGCLSLPKCYSNWTCSLGPNGNLCAQATSAPVAATVAPTATKAPVASLMTLSPVSPNATSNSPTRAHPTASQSPTTHPSTGVIIQTSTLAPSHLPTKLPTESPTASPTQQPSASPSEQPSTSPTASPTSAYVYCLPPVGPFEFDLASQFPFVEDTPSDCMPWSFGWIPSKGAGSFTLLDSLLVSGTIMPECSARLFPYVAPWGLDAYVWKAFEDNCTMLPLRRVGEYNPLAKVMLHNGRLTTVEMRFTAPVSGIYQVDVQFFPGDIRSARGSLAFNQQTVISYPTTDLMPKFERTMALLSGQTLTAWASGNSINVPVDISLALIEPNNSTAGVCPSVVVDGNLRAHLAQLQVGAPSVCAPFTFGSYQGSTSTFTPMPYGLYGTSDPCSVFFASAFGPVTSLLEVLRCTGDELIMAPGNTDTPVVRFTTQQSASYQVVLNADAGVTMRLNKLPLTSRNVLLELNQGDIIDLVASSTGTVRDFVVIYVGSAGTAVPTGASSNILNKPHHSG